MAGSAGMARSANERVEPRSEGVSDHGGERTAGVWRPIPNATRKPHPKSSKHREQSQWFDPSKGYGFIVADDNLPDILLHVTCLRHRGLQTIREGARMVCEVMKSPGGLQAVQISSVDESTAIPWAFASFSQRTHVTVVARWRPDWERIAVVK